MKLVILYGNADKEKRKKLAREIIINNVETLALIPEITTTNSSFFKMEKELMDCASLSIIFVESLATCFELSMLKEYSNIKIVYAPNANNELLKGSRFIEDTIKREFKRSDVINCSLNKLIVHYNNNIFPEIYRSYNQGKIFSKLHLEKILDYDDSKYTSNKNLKLRIAIYKMIYSIIDIKFDIEEKFNIAEVKSSAIDLIYIPNITLAQFNKYIKNILNLVNCDTTSNTSKIIIENEFGVATKELYDECEVLINELSRSAQK